MHQLLEDDYDVAVVIVVVTMKGKEMKWSNN